MIKKAVYLYLAASLVCTHAHLQAQDQSPFSFGWKKISATTAALTATAAATARAIWSTDYCSAHNGDPRCYWDWQQEPTEETSFPADFVFGAGTSSFQVEGDSDNTDWWHWEAECYPDGTPHVQERSAQACDHWHRYKEDIALAKKMGLTVFRFSLAWDKIEPKEGEYNQKAIDHYKDVIATCKEHGIKPLIGLHHYTDPVWFAQKGAFEKEENIADFVRFSTKMMAEFGHDVWLWATFNSPSGYAFHKYHLGDFPPGIKGDTQKTIEVYKNLCEAHVQVWQAAQELNKQNGSAIKVGILKNIMHIDPWRQWHPMDCNVSRIAEQLQDDAFFSFFTTGTFNGKVTAFGVKQLADVVHTNEQAPQSLDFIGVNYYSHSYMKNTNKCNAPFETATQNETYTIYPEGMYRAIKKVNERLVQPIKERIGKDVPIYVTENGIAANNPEDRLTFFKRYLYAISKAIKEGINVRGYITWSLLDNYEWRGGTDVKYGLIKVDFANGTLNRSIKDDAGTAYLMQHALQQRALQQTSKNV